MKKVTTKKSEKKSCDCLSKLNAELRPMGFVVDAVIQMDFASGTASSLIPIPLRKTGDNRSRKKAPDVIGNYCPVCGEKLNLR